MSGKLTFIKRLRPLLFYPQILTFHKILPEFTFGSTNYSPHRLDLLLASLLEIGYCFEALDITIANQNPKQIAITFDDGYAHLVRYLPPLIDKYGIQPTVFVLTGYLGKANRWDYSYFFKETRHLSKQEILTLASQGVKFGSHGHRHLNLSENNKSFIKNELRESKNILEDLLGYKITAISYPFGQANEKVIETAAKCGYQSGFTMAFPSPTDRPLARGRLTVYGFDSRLAVHQKINRGPLFGLEKFKTELTHRLSVGTALFNKIRGFR
ncbi:MAG: polysaccharide deacetylase family protein [Candidatus Zixiibacteriota bacterium]